MICLACGGSGVLRTQPFEPLPDGMRCPSCDGKGIALTDKQILVAGQRRLEEKRKKLGLSSSGPAGFRDSGVTTDAAAPGLVVGPTAGPDSHHVDLGGEG